MQHLTLNQLTPKQLEQRYIKFENPSMGEAFLLSDRMRRTVQRFIDDDEKSENIPKPQVKGADEKYISVQFKNGKGGRRTRHKRSGHKRSGKRSGHKKRSGHNKRSGHMSRRR